MESAEQQHDYAILDIIKFPKRISHIFGGFQFSLESSDTVREGSSIAFIGYPFRNEFVTCHLGHISSIYARNNVNVLQIDGSVNSGNSGGPLLNGCTGNVVGIVTRAETGYITESFDSLIRSLEQNLIIIENGKANINLGNISMRDAFRVTHVSMLEIAKSLKKSANVGIGYAFTIDPVKEVLENNTLSF